MLREEKLATLHSTVNMLSSLDIPHSPSVLLKTSAGVCLSYVVMSVVLGYFSAQARWLRKQEWIGYRKEWLSDVRAGLRSVLGTRAIVMANYEKSKEGFHALPQFMSKPLLLLPPNKLRDLLQKPDDEVNLYIVLTEWLGGKHTMESDIMRDPFHLGVVKNQLNRKLALITADVQAELALGFNQQWQVGSDNEWRTILAFETCGSIIRKGANRVFSGAELCHNEEFLKHLGRYVEGAVRTGSILNLFPKWMRPLAGPIIARRLMRKPLDACRQIALPVIQDRVQKTLSSVKDQVHVSNDALQWVIDQCIKSSDPLELDADRILRRLLGINVVALHTTSVTTVNFLLDLYSSPNADTYVEGLREECSRVLRQCGGGWSKGVVNDLFRIDSAIKESMRLHAIFTVGAIREVTKKDGVDLGDGVRVPQGVRIAAPSVAIHRDEHFYDSPYEYDAFRFSRSREHLDDEKAGIDKRSQGMVTTSESFLAFGGGRQACPGRFFASQEMKLMLAYIVMNYDVKLPGPRPQNFDFKHASVPDPRSQLMIRRREPPAKT
ncbi:Cytochrome P450 monooxygenase [Pseudocercospora fuligena]|uniref:Cytochrome P450 monooxygenase n=1 Tax=Pseudocercospora fuligena TaxID=685502 RepID=A0A8H6VHX8_9PEZI|nr:Cytochrome P450 monooxygenase [Pseudocercospora fuligena]